MRKSIEELTIETLKELETKLLAYPISLNPEKDLDNIENIINITFFKYFSQVENKTEQSKLWKKLIFQVHPERLKLSPLYAFSQKINNFNLIAALLNNFKDEIPSELRVKFFHLNILAKVNEEVKKGRVDFGGITSPVEIDETYLNTVITALERENTPLAFLTCGLLLEGRITNIADEPSDLTAYYEKRIHDAISFYEKAAVSNELKPLVNFLLWEIRTVSELESVLKRIHQFDLLPPSEDYIPSFNQYKAPSESVRQFLGSARLGLFSNNPDNARNNNKDEVDELQLISSGLANGQ